MDAVDLQLIEIDENLVRAELTRLERANHRAKRKELYEMKHPETKDGVAGAHAANKVMGRGNATEAPAIASFAKDDAAKTGVSERTVRADVKRGTSITEETKEEIQDMPEIADNGAELDVLASLSPAEQKVAVEVVKSGEAKSIRQATDRPSKPHRAKSVATPQPIAPHLKRGPLFKSGCCSYRNSSSPMQNVHHALFAGESCLGYQTQTNQQTTRIDGSTHL